MFSLRSGYNSITVIWSYKICKNLTFFFLLLTMIFVFVWTKEKDFGAASSVGTQSFPAFMKHLWSGILWQESSTVGGVKVKHLHRNIPSKDFCSPIKDLWSPQINSTKQRAQLCFQHLKQCPKVLFDGFRFPKGAALLLCVTRSCFPQTPTDIKGKVALFRTEVFSQG